jgi:peptide chain release factor 1
VAAPSERARTGLFAEIAAEAARFTEVERLIQDPTVLANAPRLRQLLREHGGLKRRVEPYLAWQKARAALAEARAEADGADDPEWKALAEEEAAKAGAEVQQLEQALLDRVLADDASGGRDAIVEMRAATGGDEACLWVEDLYRMISHWAAARGFTVELLDSTPNEVGGYRELTFAVRGEQVYDALRWESGGHRVQRVPATETQGRIHTSMATVAVLPEAEEVDVQLNPADLEITAMRAGGPGGQSVNKTSSAIRVVHKPTGEMVHCQIHKSQGKNRETALTLLRARLFEQQQRAALAARNAERRAQVGTGERSERIRTYNFPQNRVTDHRIEGGEGDEALARSWSLDPVLAGALDPIHASLREWHKRRRLAELAET